MTIYASMAGTDGGGSSTSSLKGSTTAPVLQSLGLEPPRINEASGWAGFMRPRANSDADFNKRKILLDIPAAAKERKTSLTPDMDKMPTADFANRRDSMGDTPVSSAGSTPRRGSLFSGFVGLSTTRRGSILEADEEDFRPPDDLPRRSSVTDAFQWLFKPMNAQPPQSQSRNLNVFTPSST